MLIVDGRAGSSQSCRRPESSASGQQTSGPGQFRPSLLASSYGTEAAYTESFDDVQEMEEALDRYVNYFPEYFLLPLFNYLESTLCMGVAPCGAPQITDPYSFNLNEQKIAKAHFNPQSVLIPKI